MMKHYQKAIFKSLGQFLLACTLIGCVAASTNNEIVDGQAAQGTKILPPIEVANLEGDVLKLPGDFPAQLNLVVFGFAHEQKDGVQSWVKAVSELQTGPEFAWFKMPVIDKSSLALRAVIRNGMRSGTASNELPLTLTLFVDKEKFVNSLGLNAEQPTAVLFTKTGEVVWSSSGTVSDEKISDLKGHIQLQ